MGVENGKGKGCRSACRPLFHVCVSQMLDAGCAISTFHSATIFEFPVRRLVRCPSVIHLLFFFNKGNAGNLK